jgi:hypothetical protein
MTKAPFRQKSSGRIRVELLRESYDASFVDTDGDALVTGPWRIVVEAPEAVWVHIVKYLRIEPP